MYLVTLSVLSRLITYLPTCGRATLRYRLKTAAKFHLPGGALIPAAGIAVILWLLSNVSLREALAITIATLVGLATLAQQAPLVIIAGPCPPPVFSV